MNTMILLHKNKNYPNVGLPINTCAWSISRNYDQLGAQSFVYFESMTPASQKRVLCVK